MPGRREKPDPDVPAGWRAPTTFCRRARDQADDDNDHDHEYMVPDVAPVGARGTQRRFWRAVALEMAHGDGYWRILAHRGGYCRILAHLLQVVTYDSKECDGSDVPRCFHGTSDVYALPNRGKMTENPIRNVTFAPFAPNRQGTGSE